MEDVTKWVSMYGQSAMCGIQGHVSIHPIKIDYQVLGRDVIDVTGLARRLSPAGSRRVANKPGLGVHSAQSWTSHPYHVQSAEIPNKRSRVTVFMGFPS